MEFEALGKVLIAPFEMRLPEQRSARQPDILMIKRENFEWVESVVLPGFRLRPSWLWLDDRSAVRMAFFESLSPEQRERYRRSLVGPDE